jgi:hypothetical protein
VLSGPDLRDKLSAEAVEPLPMTPEQFAASSARTSRAGPDVARERKIQLDA